MKLLIGVSRDVRINHDDRAGFFGVIFKVGVGVLISSSGASYVYLCVPSRVLVG